MQKRYRAYLATVLVLMGVVAVLGYSEAPPGDAPFPMTPEPSGHEPTPEEAFDQMMKVLTHKRCVNCHPSGDRPLQGEDSHIHNFGVQRGPDNHGVAALKC
ncbi:MAG TPA: hypothetical protein VJ933_01705, partial [Phaeodactylibacter sp.]|nr:hypothetical protein [Phaeodactylibacter sp.]